MKLKKLLRISAGLISEKLIYIFPPELIPFSGKILEQFYVYKLRKQEFQAVLDYCIKLSKRLSLPEELKKISSSYFCKASLDNKPDPVVLKKLSTLYQKKTVQSLESLIINERLKAEKYFKEALGNTGVSGAAAENLTAAFSLLSKDTSEIPENNMVSDADPVYSSKKIILSGMNWSGTGALYDYFKEFSCVGALPDEQRLWKESDYSLIWAYNSLQKLDKNDFREFLLRLFMIPITGLAVPRNYQDVFASNIGLKNIRKDKEGLYSYAVLEFLREIMELREKNSLDGNSFLNRSVKLTDRIFNTLSGNFKGHLLPDNAVHLSDIGTFRFFSNAYLLCVFRDPRSNYAARFHENVRFNRDPETYIKYYRETRESFKEKKRELSSLSDRIIEVQFEEFILSDDYRKNLASTLGLDFSGWKKHKYFKPHVSEKNVYNYRQFHDQKIMEYIADSLKEYCLPDHL